ncbi:MAG: phosphatase PAP2 family protein [Coriobacteriales bacterium]|nr:phosphatase PAP2 family protein [Coriobacteriales bacterium]
MSKFRFWYFSTLIFFILSILITIASLYVNVAPIGLENTNVGFSSINELFKNMLPYNSTAYTISTIIGYIAIMIAAIFFFVTVTQLIKRRSIKKVDNDLLALMFVYAISVAIYIVFNKTAINYRPVMPAGETELEPSFPSSHTFLFVSYFGTQILIIRKYIFDKPKIYKPCTIILLILMVVGIITRTISGVHWITDIIAGILYAMTLISFYGCCINLKR